MALLAFVVVVFVPAAIATQEPNEGVCENLDTGHLSAGGATSTTITAPAGQVIVKVCVKAGSIKQGDGPEYTTFDPGVTSVTISHSSNKQISHYSVDYETAPKTEVTAGVTFRDPTCENPTAGFTTNGATGITYTLTSGTVGPGNTVTVTATAQDGYVIVGQKVFTHTFAAVPTDCEEGDIPLPAGVTFTEATCTTGPSFQFVKTATPLGMRPFYNVEGPLVDGKPVAGATYTITALPVEGYVLVGQSVWVHTFAAAPTNCGTPPGDRCPPGMVPTAGKDGEPGNDECEFPTSPPPPAPPAPPVTTATPPAPPAPPAVTPPSPPVPTVTPPAAKTKPKAKPKTAPKPDNPPVKKKTTAVKKHVCLPYKHTDSTGKVWTTKRTWVKGHGCVVMTMGSG